MSACCARCEFNDREERVMMEETCVIHEGLKVPCIFCNEKQDDAILNDIDAVVGQGVHPRTFEDVISDWTTACIAENQTAPDPATVVVITRLGLLGQRLIYEANDVGMRQVMAETKERLGL